MEGGSWGSKVVQWRENFELKILTFIFPSGPNFYLDIRVTVGEKCFDLLLLKYS